MLAVKTDTIATVTNNTKNGKIFHTIGPVMDAVKNCSKSFKSFFKFLKKCYQAKRQFQ